jgi:hypothetical protein
LAHSRGRLEREARLSRIPGDGITAFVEAARTLENAQAMVAHESPRTTKLCDRTRDKITRDDVERITI